NHWPAGIRPVSVANPLGRGRRTARCPLRQWKLHYAQGRRIFLRAQPELSHVTVMIKHSEFAAGSQLGFGPARTAPDPASQQHDHARIYRRFGSRTHVMSTDHSAARLVLKTITIRLNPEAGQHDTDARYALA